MSTKTTPHPMRARRTVLSALRSSNPRIRASAKAAAVALGVRPGPVAKHGWRRPKPVYPVRRPFATGVLPNRDSLEG